MNNSLTFLGVIPARYASTRFPGKPLAKLGEMTMVERVYRQAKLALERVVVATDDSRIYDAVRDFGGDVVMTSVDHRSGTDRCSEAYKKAGSCADVVINIQGDEPFIDPLQIKQLMGCFEDARTQIATLVRPYPSNGDYAGLENANSPKVVFDDDGYAMLFSRSVIPFLRGIPRQQWAANHTFYTHIGMYAYKACILEEITRLPPSVLEMAESLEQLRWLENGYKIKVAVSECRTIGIDTPADLEAAMDFLRDTHQKHSIE